MRDWEVLAVPADAAREGSPTRSAGIAGIEVTLDGPVVGHVEKAPVAIIVILLGHLHGITQHKPPVLIETLTFPRLSRHTYQHDGYYQP